MSLLRASLLAPEPLRRAHAGGSGTPAPPVTARRLGLLVLLAAIGVVAFVVRLSIVVRGGGLFGLGAYDDGVYYAAADALVHGRLPYRDFLFIQPPLIAVVTTPFAALGTLVSDPTGFAIARLAYIGVGAVDAVLCGLILRRFSWAAVVVGGFGYAVFFPAVYSERSVLLEPLGTLAVLGAVLLLQHAATRPWLGAAAGVVAGLGVGAKIWYIVPALLLVLAAHPGRRLRYLIGVAVGGCVIYLPFLAAAPQAMWQEVVLDQLGRPAPGTTGSFSRIDGIVGAHSTLGVPEGVIGSVLALIAAAAVLTALTTRGARIFGVLAIAGLAVLLLSPSWFAHYTALTAAPLALCLGVGAARLSSRAPRRWARIAVVALLVVGITGANEANDRAPYGVRTPAGLNLAAEHVTGCVTADDPGTLIEMNVLSRDLRYPRCVVRPDVTGWTYDPKDRGTTTTGAEIPRARNELWQRDVVGFMESGEATIRTRSATGLSADAKRTIDSGTVLYSNHRYVVHATRR